MIDHQEILIFLSQHGVAIFETMFRSTSPFCSLTCGGIHTEKKKRHNKSFFIYFKKNESGRDFQRGQIWNDRSQKQKKKELRQSPITIVFF
jgi:hypothetical protein